MEYVSVASIGKPFGLSGQMHAFSLTSFPEMRFKKGWEYVLISPRGEEKPVTLRHVAIKGETLVLGFAEIATPEEAKGYANWIVNMDKAKAPMPEGYIRYDEIVGFAAVDDEGKEIGKLLSVLENAPTPSFRFSTPEKKTFYVPFIDEFIGDIDFEKKTINVHVVEGML